MKKADKDRVEVVHKNLWNCVLNKNNKNNLQNN